MNALDLPNLAEAYAAVAIDCCAAGAAFSRAQRLLQARRLLAAEVAIREGLDTLARVIAEMPRVEEPQTELENV